MESLKMGLVYDWLKEQLEDILKPWEEIRAAGLSLSQLDLPGVVEHYTKSLPGVITALRVGIPAVKATLTTAAASTGSTLVQATVDTLIGKVEPVVRWLGKWYLQPAQKFLTSARGTVETVVKSPVTHTIGSYLAAGAAYAAPFVVSEVISSESKLPSLRIKGYDDAVLTFSEAIKSYTKEGYEANKTALQIGFTPDPIAHTWLKVIGGGGGLDAVAYLPRIIAAPMVLRAMVEKTASDLTKSVFSDKGHENDSSYLHGGGR